MKDLPSRSLAHKKTPLLGGALWLTAASVEAVKVLCLPFSVTSWSADHWDVLFSVKRFHAAELKS